MNIGETIRNYRLQKGMSQGDIEKRTGLLRCYLSRVENGHTIPSLDTLAKIAGAMELPLSQFFAESGHTNGNKGLPQLSDDEVRFLSQIRRYSTNLNDSDRKLRPGHGQENGRQRRPLNHRRPPAKSTISRKISCKDSPFSTQPPFASFAHLSALCG